MLGSERVREAWELVEVSSNGIVVRFVGTGRSAMAMALGTGASGELAYVAGKQGLGPNGCRMRLKTLVSTVAWRVREEGGAVKIGSRYWYVYGTVYGSLRVRTSMKHSWRFLAISAKVTFKSQDYCLIRCSWHAIWTELRYLMDLR